MAANLRARVAGLRPSFGLVNLPAQVAACVAKRVERRTPPITDTRRYEAARRNRAPAVLRPSPLRSSGGASAKTALSSVAFPVFLCVRVPLGAPWAAPQRKLSTCSHSPPSPCSAQAPSARPSPWSSPRAEPPPSFGAATRSA